MPAEGGSHGVVVHGGLDDLPDVAGECHQADADVGRRGPKERIDGFLGGRELAALQHAVARVEDQDGRALDVAGGDHLGRRLDGPAVDLDLDRRGVDRGATRDAVDCQDQRDDSVDGLEVVDVDLVLGVAGARRPGQSARRRRSAAATRAARGVCRGDSSQTFLRWRRSRGRCARRGPRGSRGSGGAGPSTSGRP